MFVLRFHCTSVLNMSDTKISENIFALCDLSEYPHILGNILIELVISKRSYLQNIRDGLLVPLSSHILDLITLFCLILK